MGRKSKGKERRDLVLADTALECSCYTSRVQTEGASARAPEATRVCFYLVYEAPVINAFIALKRQRAFRRNTGRLASAVSALFALRSRLITQDRVP